MEYSIENMKKKRKALQLQVILGYEEVYGQPAPTGRLALLEGIPRSILIFEIAGLNWRLKPIFNPTPDTSKDTQITELYHFCGRDPEVEKRYIDRVNELILSGIGIDAYGRPNPTPLIFNRPGCLLALEEITTTDRLDENPDFEGTPEQFELLLRYLIAVNSQVVDFQKKELSGIEAKLEDFSIQSLIVNELSASSNPVNSLHRICQFCQFASGDPQLGPCFEAYTQSFGLTFGEFVGALMLLLKPISRDQKEFDSGFLYGINGGTPDGIVKLLKKFSTRSNTKNRYPPELLSLKQAPFWWDKTHSTYMLLDCTFLYQKSYELFLNDFWFDFLKTQKVIRFDEYRSKFGKFFEELCTNLLREGTSFLRHPRLKGGDDLKVKIGKNEVELADLYLRQNKKVLVGQVKSTGLRASKYAGDVDGFFDKGKEAFIKDFGLMQLVESLKYLRDNGKLFDSAFPVGKRIEVFPVIVTNEVAISGLLMPRNFNGYFNQLLNPAEFPIFIIHPVTVIHIDDLEHLACVLPKREKTIWEILESGFMPAPFIIKPFDLVMNGFPKCDNKDWSALLSVVRPYSQEEPREE